MILVKNKVIIFPENLVIFYYINHMTHNCFGNYYDFFNLNLLFVFCIVFMVFS